MDSPNDLHVLIIGAGISGLLLAQALQMRNISFAVYEEEESKEIYKPREWGMSIQWALPMLSQLLPERLLNELQSASVDRHYYFPRNGNTMPFYNAETGELLKVIPLVKMLRVSRRKFRSLCADGIAIQYNKKLQNMYVRSETGMPIAIFKDGTYASGTLLVGADGANSMVRRCVYPGNEGLSERVPYGGINMHVSYRDAKLARTIRSYLTPIMAIGAHPKGYWLWLSVQDVPDPKSPQDWTFQLQWTWKLDEMNEKLRNLDLEELKIEASCFAEPFKMAWTKIPPGTNVSANRISVWPPKALQDPKFVGKIALIGDAGHAMSFHRGQGMNHGVADAVSLSRILEDVRNSKSSVADGAVEYEREMIKRAGEEVAISKMNTEMVHDWARLTDSPFMLRGGDKNR